MDHEIRVDNNVAEMIGQKPSIAVLSLNLVEHPIHYTKEMMYKWSDIFSQKMSDVRLL